MKKGVMGFLFAVLFTSAYGQKLLEFDDSAPVSVFASDRIESLVVISSDSALNLSFKTNWNEEIVYWKEPEIEAGLRLYYLLFPMDEEYRGRTLFVLSQGYETLSVAIPLMPKMLKTILVRDPNVAVIGCFYQLTREALGLFQDGMYEEARAKYLESMKCKIDYRPEYEPEVRDRIARIDSIVIGKMLGDTAYDIADYYNAIEEYRKIYAENPTDKYIGSRLSEARSRQREICSADFSIAENYFFAKDYVQAKVYYDRVIAQSCFNAPGAIQKLQVISGLQQLPHALTYETAPGAGIGLSTGNYKANRASGYFTVRLNREVFEIVRSNREESARPELNVSFGWTLRVARPFWLFFGPGYTGVGEYVPKGEGLELKVNHAVSPEVGVLGKIKLTDKMGVVLRYTFQYRYALEKEVADYIGWTRHVLGVGYCF
jgi:tetratricopeptide (TPR) repeat protein